MARATTTATTTATAANGAWASQLKLLAMLTSLLLPLAWERQRNVVIWKVSGIITMTPPPPSQLTTMMICGKCSNSI